MSWYGSRTDGELVALGAGGDRSARACLVDRTLLPASRVAIHLHDDRDTAVHALVSAYHATFREVTNLEDGERFLPVLLAGLDATTPFPLDPATHAPLDPVDRDRVRGQVVGPVTPRRHVVPLAAAVVAAAIVAVVLVSRPQAPGPVTVVSTPNGGVGAVEGTPRPDPASTPSTSPAPDLEPTGGAASTGDTDAGTFDGGTGTGELAETR